MFCLCVLLLDIYTYFSFISLRFSIFLYYIIMYSN